METGIQFGIICVLLLIVISIISISLYSYHKKMIKTVEYLTKQAEAVAAGQYEDITPIDGTIETVQLVKAFNKMTKRLRIERERIASRKEELNSILSSMNNGVMAIESGGKILFYNEPFMRLLPHDREDEMESYLRESFYELFHNEDINRIVALVEEEEHPVRMEIIQGEETDKQILLVKGTPLYRKSKKKFGTLLIVEDITRVKKLETMRKDFVSNVTHELKTPLTSIRGFVDTLKEGAIEDPEYAGRFLDIIDIETERLSILVNDILILSEIESGKESGKSMVNVESVIDKVIALLNDRKKEKVTVIKDMEKPVTDYLCNQHRLQELILNLADNGVKYTNEGTVTVRCWEEETDLVLQFIDTGMGIPKEHLPRLFERFYRVDKGRSRKQGGTGLGLSIVKHIAELYKGTIEVESEVGKGSVFTVRLPYY